MPPKSTGKTVKTTASKGGTAAKPAKAAAPKGATKAPASTAKPVEAPAKPAEVAKPPEHTIKVKELAKWVIEDTDGIIKNSKWFPMLIDPSEIAGRFFTYGACTFINGLDQPFVTDPDRMRIAILAALRHGKKVIIDMMGVDLYEPLNNVLEQIEPGLLKMLLDKSIMEEKNIEKLMRPSDDDIYRDILQYGMKDDFGFVVIAKNDDTNGFTDKMMTVRVEQ